MVNVLAKAWILRQTLHNRRSAVSRLLQNLLVDERCLIVSGQNELFILSVNGSKELPYWAGKK